MRIMETKRDIIMSEIKNLNPKQAWDYMNEHPGAVLVDVRTQMEYAYVGHPVDAVHVPWKEAPDWRENPHFIEQVREKAPDPATPILLLCRSGQRSLDAAKQLAAAGYQNLVNIAEGFEGPLDENKHRGLLGGWRFHGLPWEQT